ncbi:hypothetical protein P168DRAFT_299490 [Aspergillus campestris IBT 28561]|uniref:Uncharacterized protein n=1 Tax=Aspergillus campestris (strain IBT 28561) TaxID=1392248 RepID=A0A2I1CU85_ASPC2|nr:uncharacterized protein P168DRAFT_299490 [Aspergillus campestris IBT 28561]PKY01196.1 hypothetical protein P168DRAFT_299490 [Aspergillus campestris IBT 28561]
MTSFENPSSSTVVQEVPSYSHIPSCKGSEKRSFRARLKQFWLGEIDVRWTDLILLAGTFVSGLIDGLAFNAWGNYVNMYTAIAIVSFLIGNFFFIHYGRLLGPRRRIAVVSSFAVQTLFLLVTALLIKERIINPQPDRFEPISWIQLLVASRVLAIPETPTVVLTALVADLLMDPLLYQRPWSSNSKRNRRVGAILTHFASTTAGGGMVKHTGLAGGCGFVWRSRGGITLTFAGWNEKPPVPSKNVV